MIASRRRRRRRFVGRKTVRRPRGRRRAAEVPAREEALAVESNGEDAHRREREPERGASLGMPFRVSRQVAISSERRSSEPAGVKRNHTDLHIMIYILVLSASPVPRSSRSALRPCRLLFLPLVWLFVVPPRPLCLAPSLSRLNFGCLCIFPAFSVSVLVVFLPLCLLPERGRRFSLCRSLFLPVSLSVFRSSRASS